MRCKEKLYSYYDRNKVSTRSIEQKKIMNLKLFGKLQLLVFTAVICFAKYEDFSNNITFQGKIS